MFPFSLRGPFAKFRDVLGGRELSDVASMSELERAFQLEHEWHRRTGKSASLVVFVPAGERSRSFHEFVLVLRSQVRSNDVIGWLDSERIAILLPETNKRSALTLAEGVLDALAPSTMDFDCVVMTYPSDWPGHEHTTIRQNARPGPTPFSERSLAETQISPAV